LRRLVDDAIEDQVGGFLSGIGAWQALHQGILDVVKQANLCGEPGKQQLFHASVNLLHVSSLYILNINVAMSKPITAFAFDDLN